MAGHYEKQEPCSAIEREETEHVRELLDRVKYELKRLSTWLMADLINEEDFNDACDEIYKVVILKLKEKRNLLKETLMKNGDYHSFQEE